jgi:hypothetical protein
MHISSSRRIFKKFVLVSIWLSFSHVDRCRSCMCYDVFYVTKCGYTCARKLWLVMYDVYL